MRPYSKYFSMQYRPCTTILYRVITILLYHDFKYIWNFWMESVYSSARVFAKYFFDKEMFRYSIKVQKFNIRRQKFLTTWFTFCHHYFSIKVKFLFEILFIWFLRSLIFRFLIKIDFIYLSSRNGWMAKYKVFSIYEILEILKKKISIVSFNSSIM